MTHEELMKKLIETDDRMERMTLVENYKPVDSSLVTSESPIHTDEIDWKMKYTELEKRYIDTFFTPKDKLTHEPLNTTVIETVDVEEKTPEEKRAETITIDELLKEGKK